MTRYYYGFHVVSFARISEDVLNRLHHNGYDWQISPRHVGQDGFYHYHYIFYSDSCSHSISTFRKIFYCDSNIVFVDVVQNVNAFVQYVFHR